MLVQLKKLKESIEKYTSAEGVVEFRCGDCSPFCELDQEDVLDMLKFRKLQVIERCKLVIQELEK